MIVVRVEADRNRCHSSGLCVHIAPEVFDQDAEGVVEVLADHPEAGLQDAVRRAALCCPAEAIRVTR